MRHYEVVVVLSPMLNQEQSADTWGRIKEFIASRKGEITHEERWGTRRLAYAIRKGGHNFLEGNYHLTRFSTEQLFIRELETFLRVDEQVLRSLVVATAPPKPAPPTAAAKEVSAVPASEEVTVAAVVEAVLEVAPAPPEAIPATSAGLVAVGAVALPATPWTTEASSTPEVVASSAEVVLTPATEEGTAAPAGESTGQEQPSGPSPETTTVPVATSLAAAPEAPVADTSRSG